MSIQRFVFGKTSSGEGVDQFVLSNENGLAAKVITFGATLTSLISPDRHGRPEEIILGYDNLEGYLLPHPYFGSTVGRFANRIARGKFSIDGKVYQVACNDNGNHLHGGNVGFNQRL
ncbi:MAG TPA: galactose-1-epimerase, partial [Spirochaetia bacterium]|nr:galactose-1-epimerase [Spirochaetia bacterium]